jgi:hypothetical protein
MTGVKRNFPATMFYNVANTGGVVLLLRQWQALPPLRQASAGAVIRHEE